MNMQPKIKAGPNWLRIEDRIRLGKGSVSLKRRFARRVFALPEVESLSFDPAAGSALVRFRPGDDGKLLSLRLADAVSGRCVELDDSALPVWPTDERAELHRRNGAISCLQVIRKGPREIEFRLPGFFTDGKQAARRISSRLEAEGAVERISLSPLTGRLRVRLKPGANAEAVIRRTEELLPATRFQHTVPRYRPVAFGAANLNMALCGAGQFVFPAMIPLASGVLLATRLGTFRDAGSQLARGKLGVPVFQTVVVACSVATGSPIVSALAEWLGCFWQRRWRRKVAAETHALLNEAFPLTPRAVAVDEYGVETNVAVAALKPGDRIKVRETELIPVDGWVVAGEGLADETRLRGSPGPARKRPHDRVFASSLLVAGNLTIEVRDTQTEAARLAGAIADRAAAMSEDRGLRQQAAAAAERSVLPNLALAGVGLATGGLHTVSAILHQDWITGPHVAFPTQSFRDMQLALRFGAPVNSPTALSRLGEVDILVIDGDVPALLAPGVELENVHASTDDTAELLRQCASIGVYLGDARSEALTAACRTLALAPYPADGVQLGPGLTRGIIGNQTVSLTDDTADPSNPAPSVRVQVDGKEAARLSFRLSAGPKAAESLGELRALGLTIVVVSREDHQKAAELSKRLGADLGGGEMGTAEKIRFLKKLAQSGRQAAYLGTADIPDELAAVAHVTLGLGGAAMDGRPADISLTGATIAPLPRLLELGKTQEAKVGSACKRALLPNALCIAGAFTGALNGTTSTLLANVGVMNVDRRQRRLLDGKLAPA